MTSLRDRAEALIQTFDQLPGWEERYRKIIEMGRALPDMPDALKTDDLKVKGCQSQVWLQARLDEDGRVRFQADSDALITKGLIAVLLNVYSDATPADILQFPPEFLKSLGFEGNLSPSRANGLNSMIKQVRNYAVAFDFLQKKKNTN